MGLRFTLVLLALAVGLAVPGSAAARWRTLEPGLDLGTFELPERDGAKLTALRIDAAIWDVGVHCASEYGLDSGRTTREWCEALNLAAAINAGMYATDFTTHVGYLRNGKHVNSSHRNAYRSVAVLRPRREGLPPFRIVDLDAPGTSMDSLVAQYGTVVQNLRLIKRPRENRWTPQPKRWSEAALGEDSKGRALFLLCSTPLSMHEFNEQLLALPLDLVCAQHLEGGPEAQIYIRTAKETRGYFGAFAEGGASGSFAWRVPNVLGIRRKK
jgi:hypothetical protein